MQGDDDKSRSSGQGPLAARGREVRPVDDPGTVGQTVTVEGLHRDATAAQLASIVQSSSDAIFSTDLDGTIVSWNPAAAELFGYESSEIVGHHVRRLVPADKALELAAVMEVVLAGSSVSDEETVGLRADRVLLDLSATMSPLRDSAGTVIGTSTIARDIRERIELHRRIAAERRRLLDAQASAELGSFEIDLVENTLTRSDEFWRIIGRTPSDESGQDFSFVHPEDLPLIEAALLRVIEGESGVECTHRIVRPSGEVRWVVTRSSRFRDLSDRVIGGTMLDITDRREAELALEHLAYHDPLTGLANRSRITQQLDELLAAPQAHGRRVTVALIDIDQFKVVNDSLGHSTGDSVLVAVARRIETALEPGESLARFGGDEFAVIRSDDGGFDAAAAFGERLRTSLDAPVTIDAGVFDLTMSVGVALSEPGASADSMFRGADTAMYHAKELGRARVALYDEELQRSSRRRLQLRAALRTALELDELSIVYQPVIDLATMRSSGFEALLRWTSPTFGAVSPAEFIPLAEETGLIVPIGEWVLRESLAQLAAWRRDLPPDRRPWMAVNLSARQTESPGLIDRVASALADAGVPADALHLELTESELMDTIESSLETMHAFHALGITLSIDDFGTGYSSLSYLKRLPIDIVKIDKSFVDGLGVDVDDTSIVQAIIELARTLKVEVVAEGIETATQLQALRDLGCSYGQGFHWSPGVPAEQAAAWVDRTIGPAPDALA